MLGLTLRLSGRCLLFRSFKLGFASSVETPAFEKCPAKERAPLVVVGVVVPVVTELILLKLLKMEADVFERLSLSGKMRLLVVPVRAQRDKLSSP